MDKKAPTAIEQAYSDFYDAVTRLLKSQPSRRASHVRNITALAKPVYAVASQPVYDAAALLHELAVRFPSVPKREEMTFKKRIAFAQAMFKNVAKKEVGT